MKATIVVPRFEPRADLPTAVSRRELLGLDALAHRLGEALGIDVPLVEGELAAAPSSGFLVVPDVARDIDPALGPRIVAVDEGRSSIMTTVERFNLAAAIETYQYSMWR